MSNCEQELCRNRVDTKGLMPNEESAEAQTLLLTRKLYCLATFVKELETQMKSNCELRTRELRIAGV